MSSYAQKSAIIKYRRSTAPTFRDIRDRPTWELLDRMYINVNPTMMGEPNSPPDVFEQRQTTQEANMPGQTIGTYFAELRRALRKNSRGNYTSWDGTVVFINGYLFELGIVSDGRFNFYQQLVIGAADNTQVLTCEALHEQDVINGIETTVPAVIFSVRKNATGSWTGATNAIVATKASQSAVSFSVFKFQPRITAFGLSRSCLATTLRTIRSLSSASIWTRTRPRRLSA